MTAATVEIKMVGKLSTKNAGISPKKIHGIPDDEDSLKLCTIVGIADGVKQVEDTVHGKVFYPLTGRFEGINPETGTKTRSGVLYLPTGIHETYEAAVRKLEEGDSIRFAIEIRAVRAENPAGYSYEAVDLLPIQEVDPLTEIANKLSQKQAETKQIEAPKAPEPQTQAKAVPPTQAGKPVAHAKK